MLLKLAILLTTASIVLGSKAKHNAKSAKKDEEYGWDYFCQSPRYKDLCESGEKVVGTKVDIRVGLCGELCRECTECPKDPTGKPLRTPCKAFFQTEEHDCVFLKVEGKSTKELGLPGPDYEVKSLADVPPPVSPDGKRQSPPQLTFEDCVEFNFDECKENTGPPGWSDYTNTKRENTCIVDCNQCENNGCPQDIKCGSLINRGNDSTVPGNQQDCWRGESRNLVDLTNKMCAVRWGTVKKEPIDRFKLKGCVTGFGIRCMRGKCDRSHLVEIPMANTLFFPAEENCQDSCWSHSNPNTGDCTHYKWVPNSQGGRGQCLYYQRKNKQTAETNYKCELYSLSNSATEIFSIASAVQCKSGGARYYKPTALCPAMCSATLGDQARIEFPLAIAMDITSSQGGPNNKVRLDELINKLNATKAPSYQLVEFGNNVTKDYPKRTNYTDFKKDLDGIQFTGNQPYQAFEKGLKPVCEKADASSFIIATIDEQATNLTLEADIAKCLIDKKATLFIALNPPFQNFTDSMDAYRRLAEGSGGKVVNIFTEVDTLVTAIDSAMDTICNCALLRDPVAMKGLGGA